VSGLDDIEDLHEESMEPEWQERISRSYQAIHSSSRIKITEGCLTEILDGCYDTHVHAGPDSYGWRCYSEADVARKAVDYNFGGVVFKCQWAPSSAREQFVKELADIHAEKTGKRKIDIFSGVCLSTQVGGYNPAAVDASFRVGGKYVWTPTKDSAHHKRASMDPSKGLECVGEDGKLIPELHEIFKMIAENDGILGISHQSTRERFMMVKAAQELGVQRIVIEHPQLHVSRMTVDQLKELASVGVFLGLTYVCAVPNYIVPEIDKFELSTWVKAVGTGRWVSQTDLSQLQNPDPVEGLRMLAKVLLSQGINEKDIRQMFVDNPRELLY